MERFEGRPSRRLGHFSPGLPLCAAAPVAAVIVDDSVPPGAVGRPSAACTLPVLRYLTLSI